MLPLLFITRACVKENSILSWLFLLWIVETLITLTLCIFINNIWTSYWKNCSMQAGGWASFTPTRRGRERARLCCQGGEKTGRGFSSDPRGLYFLLLLTENVIYSAKWRHPHSVTHMKKNIHTEKEKQEKDIYSLIAFMKEEPFLSLFPLKLLLWISHKQRMI